jgi:hypothetical protein
MTSIWYYLSPEHGLFNAKVKRLSRRFRGKLNARSFRTADLIALFTRHNALAAYKKKYYG